MEDFNTFDDVQEQVVDAPETEPDTSEVAEVGEDINVPTTEAEPSAPVQSAEENAKFAELRRKYEAEQKAIKSQNDRLMAALSQYGYEGSPEEIADALMAQTQGISQEEAKAQREAQEKAETERLQMQSETEFYKKIAIEKLMNDDLKTIQSVYPEVKSLNELGEEFFNLLGATRDPILSYEALQAKKAKTQKPVPQEIGAVNSSSSKEKDFYSPAEVDKLTEKDFDNPKIMEVVRKSMLKWK